MDLLHAFILALVQGITEFLPISSSAHLILIPYLFGWTDQGLVYDIAAHVGTLAAVVVYFRRDLKRIIRDGLSCLVRRQMSQEGRLLWLLIGASVPIVIGGYLLHDLASDEFRSPLIIAGANIVFAGLLWWSDYHPRQDKSLHNVSWRDALLIGLAQVLAIIPGTSRSGVTMTTGLLLGMTRQAAARFSFLLSIPVILIAGSYELYRMAMHEIVADWQGFMLVAVLSFGSAIIAIHLFLRLLDRFGMLPYVIYRFALGAVLLVVFI